MPRLFQMVPHEEEQVEARSPQTPTRRRWKNPPRTTTHPRSTSPLMSCLFSADKPEPRKARIHGPILRKRRKQPLHPEEIEKRLREKAVEEMPKTGWHWPFGWVLLLWKKDGTKRKIDIPASEGYEGAVRERDAELEFSDEYEGATLIRKTYEKKQPRHRG